MDRDLAGGAILAESRVLEGQAAFEPADDVADADLARGAGEAVTPFAADLAVEEPAAPQRQQNRLEELVRQPFFLGQVLGVDEIARPVPGELHDRPDPVFRSLR